MMAAGIAGFTARELRAPWGGALLRLIADPLEHADPEALPGFPAALPLPRALATPALRGRLGRALCDTSPAALATLRETAQVPRARLALVPAAEAVGAMALATSWMLAPQIGTLIRPAELRAVRAALGEEAYAFALRRATMLPPASATLAAALGLVDPAAEIAGIAALRPGAALFGLAAGALPEPLLARLRLRRPAASWAIACAHCRTDPAGDAALAALRRLLRDRAPSWSSWLS